ncbi:MAG: nucleoside-diphosphate sugar epimerase/dehydratase [Novosphingobium sp.]|nr:nucleoside-diphosphate sugar epimerase/dehydratase [Novosphingobium sp.]
MELESQNRTPTQIVADAEGTEGLALQASANSSRMLKFMFSMINLGRGQKRAIIVAIDALLCVLSVFVAFALRVGALEFPLQPRLIFLVVALPLFIPIFHSCGVYKAVLRFVGARGIRDLAVAMMVYALVLMIVFMAIGVPGIPRTVAILHPIIFLGLATSVRIIARHMLMEMGVSRSFSGEVKRVMIYGAGLEGQQLAMQLRHEPSYQLSGFFDDDAQLVGQKVDGSQIYHSSRLAEMVSDRDVGILFLAMPTLTRRRNREIVDQLAELRVQVQMLPPLREIVDGKVSISALREVKIDDLLGRDPVAPNPLLLRSTVFDKVVLVTGAGGSIGSELCRQIVRLRPRRLVLVEMTESALYQIDKELGEIQAGIEGVDVEVIPEMASLTDADGILRIFSKWRPDTIIHAAAYKHVPLVEANVVSGLRNNVMGTVNAANAARAVGVERFILVSTDKAVRPTSVMGASKRVCELVLQALATRGGETRFAMVRFGNVLGSSGSVVPLFKQQIAEGGPITVTHRDVTRYFMTIPEAAQLVIQTCAMAQSGEVFLLDMGPSIKIHELARTMIHLSGLSVRDEENPGGDIEIVESGLRPGEKLYEELLIDAASEPTKHPRISKAREDSIAPEILVPQINDLTEALANGDAQASLVVLRKLVPEYRGEQGSSGQSESA